MRLLASFTGTGVLPQLASAVAITSRKVKLTFSELMLNNGAYVSPLNYVITHALGSANRTVASVLALSQTEVQLTLDGDMTAGVLNYTVTVSLLLEDIAGNTINPAFRALDYNGIAPSPPAPPPSPPDETPIVFLDMYDFIIFEIRKNDLQGSPRPGTEFLKRYLKGPNRQWQQTIGFIRSLPDLWNIEKIADDKLKFLKAIVGWTDAPLQRKVTEAISDESLRRLIAVSGRLWKQRGPEDTIIDILSLLTVARCRIWNWFDFRWILDETELGEEHQGRDAWLVHLPATVEQELLIDQNTFFNKATGNSASATVPQTISSDAKPGDVFRITDGPQSGYQAKIAGIVGASPATINFDPDFSTNGIVGPFTNVTWNIVDEQFAPDDYMRSNLRIVDNGALDRTLVRRILQLMRPTGERFDITYLTLLDLFLIEGDDTQWNPPTGGNLAVTGGMLQLDSSGVAEDTYAIDINAVNWAQYVVSARMRGTSTIAAALWGLTFYRTNASNYYSFLLDTVLQLLYLKKTVAGVTSTIATADLSLLGFNIYPDVFYTLRATIVIEGATNRIQLFVDGFKLVNTTDNALVAGSVGFKHDINAKLDVDEIEVFELALGVDSVEINSTN